MKRSCHGEPYRRAFFIWGAVASTGGRKFVAGSVPLPSSGCRCRKRGVPWPIGRLSAWSFAGPSLAAPSAGASEDPGTNLGPAVLGGWCFSPIPARSRHLACSRTVVRSARLGTDLAWSRRKPLSPLDRLITSQVARRTSQSQSHVAVAHRCRTSLSKLSATFQQTANEGCEPLSCSVELGGA